MYLYYLFFLPRTRDMQKNNTNSTVPIISEVIFVFFIGYSWLTLKKIAKGEVIINPKTPQYVGIGCFLNKKSINLDNNIIPKTQPSPKGIKTPRLLTNCEKSKFFKEEAKDLTLSNIPK